ncbi:unnamed protein product, partial [Rotaria sordida]
CQLQQQQQHGWPQRRSQQRWPQR